MALKLIHFPNSRSLRVLWAIEELGLEADIDLRPFDLSQTKTPEYRALNPLGKIPVLIDDGVTIIESMAIVEYLANRYADGKLTRKPRDEDYARYLQWLHFGEGGMGGYVSMLVGQTVLLPEDQRIPAMKTWAARETKNCLDFIEAGLDEDGYMLSEFSLADIAIGYMLFLIKITRNGDLLEEKTKRYFKRLTARPAWKKASSLAP